MKITHLSRPDDGLGHVVEKAASCREEKKQDRRPVIERRLVFSDLACLLPPSIASLEERVALETYGIGRSWLLLAKAFDGAWDGFGDEGVGDRRFDLFQSMDGVDVLGPSDTGICIEEKYSSMSTT